MRLTSRYGLALAFSVVVICSATFAEDVFFNAPNGRPVNMVKDGGIIQGGTYYNSENGKTTFVNSDSGSLWLKSGTTVRGIQVDETGHATGHGGNVHLLAPNSVVRVDGDINVNNVMRQDPFFGNGGNVTVDAAFYYQNGNIFANGYHGGMVLFNVGSASFANTASIQAQGYSAPGSIRVNASGVVDIGRNAMMSVESGSGFPTGNSNLLSIEGSLVNMEGVLRANSQNIDGSTVRLISKGNTSLVNEQAALQQAVQAGSLTSNESNVIGARFLKLTSLYDGDIRVASASNQFPAAQIQANGGTNLAEDSYVIGRGGDIIMTAQRDILNGGVITANGSYGLLFKGFQNVSGAPGGSITMQAGRNIHNSNRIVTDGGMSGEDSFETLPSEGGTGGIHRYTYGGALFNSGVIRSHGGTRPASSEGIGGHGGTIIFNGSTPRGTGIVSVLGGPASSTGQLGSIVAPDPAASSNILIGKWEKEEPEEAASN